VSELLIFESYFMNHYVITIITISTAAVDVVTCIYRWSYTCEAVRAIWWSTVGLHQCQLYKSKQANIFV